MFHDVKLGEGLLQNFEVVEVLILKFGFPVNFGKGDFPWVDNIQQLAIESTCTKLLYFCNIAFEKSVDPDQQLAPRQFNGIIGVAGNFVNHNR